MYFPGPWGSIRRYKDEDFRPFNYEKIIYGFHFYTPHHYTHQGIKKLKGIKMGYPGHIGSKYWNKERIVKHIAPAISWSEKYNKLLFVGEFSVVRWAEGRDQYLDDVMTIFDKNNISYTYWSLNGWTEWAPNAITDSLTSKPGKRVLMKSPTKTSTMKHLEKHWKSDNTK